MHTFLKNFTNIRSERNRSVVITIKLVTFFMNGITFTILSRIGNMPWLKNRFIISLKDFESSFLNNFKILVGILFGSIALFVFIELIKFSMSFGRVGERKIVFLFSWPR